MKQSVHSLQGNSITYSRLSFKDTLIAAATLPGILTVLLFVVFPLYSGAQTIYKWRRSGSQSFTVASNWTPARNFPAATDILVFNGNGTAGVTATVTNVPTQTIAGLQVYNNTNVTFVSPAANGTYTLTINNGTSVSDFEIQAGSQLSLSGSRATHISLSAGAAANISGKLTFSNAAHQLLAAGAGAIQFNSGAVFTASSGFSGSAFGNSGLPGTVQFNSGAEYISNAGTDPFGLAAPASKLVFNQGSMFTVNQANGAGLDLNGRMLSNVTFNGGGTATYTGAGGFMADDIVVNSGTVNIGLTGTSIIRGNITLARTTNLSLQGNNGTVLLDGTAQTISGRGKMSMGNGQLTEVSSGAAVTLASSITVTGSATALTVKGTLNTGTRTISGTGKFILASGATLGIGSTTGITASGNSGAVRTSSRSFSNTANYVYNGTNNQVAGNGLPAQAQSLTINNSGRSGRNTITLTNALDVAAGINSVVLQSGILNLNNKQLTVDNGGTLVATGGSMGSTAGTIYFAGNGTVSGAVGFTTVIVAGAVDFGTGSNIQTLLQVNNGGSVISHSPVYGSSATVLYNVDGTAFHTGMEWVPGNVVGAGVPQNITLNLASASASVTLNDNLTVMNTLTLSRGNLSIGSNTLTLKGGVSRSAGFLKGSHFSNLVISGAAGNLWFTSGEDANYLKNFTINNGASASLATSLNITAGTAPGNEGLLTVTGTGVLTTRGLLTITSNAFGTASIGQGRTNGGYISGAVTVERFIPQNINKAWRLIAAPTTGQTIKEAWQENQAPQVNGIPGYGTMIPGKAANLAAARALGFDSLSPAASLYKYNPATDNLDPVTNTSGTPLSAEQGYFIFIRGDRSPGQMGFSAGNAASSSTTLRSTGTLYLGDQAATTVPAGRWALIRNPYASALDLTKVVITGGVVNAFQVWDPKLNGLYGTGAYQTLTKSGANYVITPGGGSYGPNGSIHNTIESGAAFFVQAPASLGTVRILENCKTTGSELVFRPAGILSNDQRLLFSLYASSGSGHDLVDGGIIYFDATGNNAVDIDDVRKSTNFGENFGIENSGTELVVEKRAIPASTDTVHFKMYQLKQTNYRLRISAENLAQLSEMAFLVDRYLNVSTPVSLTDSIAYDFTVTADAASKAADRFMIIFKPVTVLPLEFISVTATRRQANVHIAWKVANGQETRQYEVWHSADGVTFSHAGSVAAGPASAYSFDCPGMAPGNQFYRIKAVDRNGHSYFSETVQLFAGNKAPSFTVSPNPVTGNEINIGVTNQVPGRYQLNMLNMAGQRVFTTSIQLSGTATSCKVSLPDHLPAGIFQLSLIGDDQVPFTQKIILRK